jgi:cysteine synthase
MIKKSTLELIGNTSLVNLDKLTAGKFRLYGKQEYIQPGGSVKDRAALQIISDAYLNHQLTIGQVVVEMTSGNMGAGLAVVCRQTGNPFIAVMPRGNSPERIKILESLGAEVVLTKQIDGKPGMVTGKDIEYASEVAKQMAAHMGGFYVDQFNNPSSIKAHYETTGPEILKDLPSLDVFITSVGSGGTFMGIARFLKEQHPEIKCIAVEPENAAILKTGKIKNAKHIIQGTGYGLIPPHWDEKFADAVMTVSDKEVKEITLKLWKEQGLFVGYSSGANVAAALKFADENSEVKNVVTILCDSGYKYPGF